MRCINKWGGALEKAAARVRATDVHQMFPHASYTLAQPVTTLAIVFYKCGWSVRHKSVLSVAFAKTKKKKKKKKKTEKKKNRRQTPARFNGSRHAV